jgi:hypothetical protein
MIDTRTFVHRALALLTSMGLLAGILLTGLLTAPRANAAAFDFHYRVSMTANIECIDGRPVLSIYFNPGDNLMVTFGYYGESYKQGYDLWVSNPQTLTRSVKFGSVWVTHIEHDMQYILFAPLRCTGPNGTVERYTKRGTR